MLKRSGKIIWLLWISTLYPTGCSNEREEVVPNSVSLIKVISEPNSYINKRIMFIGYIGDESNGPFINLFISKDDSRLKNYPNSILVIQPKTKRYSKFCKNYYVEVKGVMKEDEGLVYLEIEGYMRPFDRDTFEPLYNTCEPTDNQVSERP